MKSYIPVMLKYNASENIHADVELFSSIDELYFLVILQIREQHEQEAATHPLAP